MTLPSDDAPPASPRRLSSGWRWIIFLVVAQCGLIMARTLDEISAPTTLSPRLAASPMAGTGEAHLVEAETAAPPSAQPQARLEQASVEPRPAPLPTVGQPDGAGIVRVWSIDAGLVPRRTYVERARPFSVFVENEGEVAVQVEISGASPSQHVEIPAGKRIALPFTLPSGALRIRRNSDGRECTVETR